MRGILRTRRWRISDKSEIVFFELIFLKRNFLTRRIFMFLKNIFATILFAIVCAIKVLNNQKGSIALDILCPPAAVRENEPSPFIEAGKLSTGNIKNVIRIKQFPFDATDGAKETLDVYTRTTPVGDATLAVLPIGSICEMFTFSSAGVVSQYDKWTKKWTGAYGWVKAIEGADSLSATTLTAAGELARIWGQSSATSGIFRGLSVRTLFTGAGTATGDALRAYNLTNVSIANMHGAHITAQLGSEDAASVGTVTGEASGVRATIGIGLTNTAPAGGTIASLRCDSYFLSTAAGAASSFIYFTDVNTSYGVDAFFRCGPITNRGTAHTETTKAYIYESGHITVSNCDAVFKMVTQDGAFWIPGYTTLA
jgi:hypothetical protein